MTPSPIEAMVGWLNDPLVVQYSEQRHKRHTVESQIEYLKTFVGSNDFMMICDGTRIIGTISAYIDAPNRIADVGILIGEWREWGKGYGTEAWTAFCDHLFECNIRKIEAGCMSANLGMIGICQRYKMAPEGLRLGHFLLSGIPCSMSMWGRFA